MATATHFVTPEEAQADGPLEAVVVRFAGDSGDGMQLTGGQFTLSTALAGNDLATFPIFPAESARRRGRRSASPPSRSTSAPRRSRRGRCARRAGRDEPGGAQDQQRRPEAGGLIIADEGEFGARNLAKAGYETIRWRTTASPSGR
jgi:2-oxoglutarate ferredoxin oxidoreductase subunit alpha